MKKSSILMLVCGLALMLVMYNCTKADHPDPQQPDQSLVDKINALNMKDVPLVDPEPVLSTPSSIEKTPELIALVEALEKVGPGTLPKLITDTGDAIALLLTPAEIATLNAITDTQLDALKAGGELPADWLAIVNKAKGSPALAALLPLVKFPTVNGVTISALRTGGVDAIEKTEVSDVCIAAAQAVFDVVKVKLDGQLAAQLAAVDAKYAAGTTPLPGNEVTCIANISEKYAALLAAEQAEYVRLKALLETIKTFLGPVYHPYYTALLNLGHIAFLDYINKLKKADTLQCATIEEASTDSAEVARDKNKAAVQAEYDAIIKLANAIRIQLYQSCHNQGAGGL